MSWICPFVEAWGAEHKSATTIEPYTRACRTITNTALLLLVGSRYFLYAHSFLAWSLLRCCLLGSSVQAQSVARVGWSGLRSWTCVGGGRLYVNSYLNLLYVQGGRCVANVWFLQLPSAGVTRLWEMRCVGRGTLAAFWLCTIPVQLEQR